MRHLVTELPTPEARAAYLCRPESAGLVIGSSQPLDSVDEHACSVGGYALVRRGSGGGAVVVAPGAQVWLDLFVPAEDELFDNDVNRATHFVGELWRTALCSCSAPDVEFSVHTGPNEVNAFSRAACFAGLGPGEVHLARRKVVGMSQRRTRKGAWFFSMALLAPRHLELTSLLALAPAERERLGALLSNDVAVLDLDPGALESALASALGEGSPPR